MTEHDSDAPQPPKKSDAERADECEIDRVLAEAAGLTQQLQGEIGSEPLPALGPDVDLDQARVPRQEVDVDSQLDAVEELLRDVESAAQEPGSNPPSLNMVEPAPGATKDAHLPASPRAAQKRLPTAQLETDPITEAVESLTAEDQTPHATGIEADRLSEGEVNIEKAESNDADGRPIDASNVLPATDAQRSPQTAGDGTLGNESTSVDSSKVNQAIQTPAARWQRPESGKMGIRSCAKGIIARLKKMVLGMFEFMLSVFDVIDRLFSWISYDVRRILGWIALALLVAACSITLCSLF